MDKFSSTIDRRDYDALSYNEFVENYMKPGKPVVLVNAHRAMRDWYVWKEWTICKHTGDCGERQIDTQRIVKDCGEEFVPVVDCATGDRKTVKLRDYFDSEFAPENSRARTSLYLKDWHAQQFMRDKSNLYITPEFFRDDWLNWWWEQKSSNLPDERKNDYKFVYIGPKSSRTPLHQDLVGEHLWTKKVAHVPPFRDFEHDLDTEKYPNAKSASYQTVIQQAGEIIFVPSGWYHQVENLEDTLSVNHNWFNGWNIHHVWSFLQKEFQAVEKEIGPCFDRREDNEEYMNQCQLILKANSGMDFEELGKLLLGIQAEIRCNETMAQSMLHAKNHRLKGIREILQDLKQFKCMEVFFANTK